MSDIFGGPTLDDLARIYEAQNYTYSVPRSVTNSPPRKSVRACFCVGHLYNGGRCCQDVPVGETRQSDMANDKILPKDDPTTPRPSPLAGSWQCGGCGTIYSPCVNKCECQKRATTNSGNGLNWDGD